jgi:hypothetical protein
VCTCIYSSLPPPMSTTTLYTILGSLYNSLYTPSFPSSVSLSLWRRNALWPTTWGHRAIQEPPFLFFKRKVSFPTSSFTCSTNKKK